MIDGRCVPIPPSEILAWAQLTGNIVWPAEYAILAAMDRAYCDEMNIELENARIQREEEHKRELEANKGKGRKKR